MSGKFQPLIKNDALLHNTKQEFMHDVLLGLSKLPKHLPSKYFYDERGSELFNQITRNPDYYLTNCELEILKTYKSQFSSLLKDEAFNLIELGPGEGIKTTILIEQFLKNNLSFNYYPVDISKKYLNHLIEHFDEKLPQLETIALHSDYLNGIKWLSSHSNKRNFILFLGSSIGNFNANAVKDFLQTISRSLHQGDYILIGFDLLKDIDSLMQAYNDHDGLTRRFNLNLLDRMNKELGANFNVQSFQHYGTYNVYKKAMESYLISDKEQIVYIDALKKSFGFKKFEAIHVETSQKYLLSQVNELACQTNFKVVTNFMDEKHYFLNALWCVK